MGDRFNTVIAIGGKLPKSHVSDLASVVRNCNFGYNYDCQSQQELTQIMLEPPPKSKKYLEFTNPECPINGEDDITEFCRTWKLPYDLRIEGKYEFSGEIHWWKPGMKNESIWCETDTQAAQIMISLPKLRQWAKSGMTLQAVIKKLRTMIPELPPFTTI